MDNATFSIAKLQHILLNHEFFSKIDGLTPVFMLIYTLLRFTLCRFAPVYAYATSAKALYALTLVAKTIFPRKARREPTYESEYEAP